MYGEISEHDPASLDPHVLSVHTTVPNQPSDSMLSHTCSANQVTDTECDYYANLESPKAPLNNQTECVYVTEKHQQELETEGLVYSVINKIK